MTAELQECLRQATSAISEVDPSIRPTDTCIWNLKRALSLLADAVTLLAEAQSEGDPS